MVAEAKPDFLNNPISRVSISKPGNVVAPPPPPPPPPAETAELEPELLSVVGVVVPPELALATDEGELPSSPLANTRKAVKLLCASPTESVTVS